MSQEGFVSHGHLPRTHGRAEGQRQRRTTTAARGAMVAALFGAALACAGDGRVTAIADPDLPIEPPQDEPQIAQASGWLPQGTVICDEDFSRFSSWGAFMSGARCNYSNMGQMANWGRNNVDIDADGLMYRVRAEPLRCGDQIVGQATIPLQTATRQIWIEFTNKWSSNYTNVNSNCSTPLPDYKHVLFWFTSGQKACGHVRSDFKTGIGSGGGLIHHSAPGFPQCDDVVVNPNGSTATVRHQGAHALYDGNWHTFRLYTAMLGSGRYQVYTEVDGLVVHDYVTTSVNDPALTFGKVMLGSNRNLGATEDMFLWWRSVKIWAR